MFTGIIKEVAKVGGIEKKANLWKIGIKSDVIYPDVCVSESISVNGVCLTLVDKNKGILFFEIIKPSLEATNLKRLKFNTFVNLESSLKVGEKVGGHFVLGHIDCESQIRRIRKQIDFYVFEIKLPPKFKTSLVEKGSIAVEGISLTVQKISNDYFSVNVIPYTFDNTNLKYKKAGDWVNLEFDYLLKRR